MKPKPLSIGLYQKKKTPFLLSSKFMAIQFVALVLLSVFAFVAVSHSGRTDSNGGHYNRSTGSYHYHHGYPAHQHKNGVCPYRSEAKTTSEEATDEIIDDEPDDEFTFPTSSGKYTTEAQYALMTANQKTTENKKAESETTKSDDKDSQSGFLSEFDSDPLLPALFLIGVLLLVIFIIFMVARTQAKEKEELENSLDSYKRQFFKKDVEVINLKEDLRLKEIRVKSLKEDLNLKKIECEDKVSEINTLQAECNLYKLRANYMFVTKHLCDPDYKRFYLDSLDDLEQLTISPFDTMKQVAPMVADFLLCSIKQAEEKLSNSERGCDQNKAVKIANIRKETKGLLSKYIQNQYKLEYLLRTFPELNYFIVPDTSYRNSEVYMQTRENIAETLPDLRTPTKARWHVFFSICMHHLFEFGSPPVYEMIFQKLTSEISQMIKDDSEYIWDLNMQISSLSLLFGISSELLKTAISFSFSGTSQITEALHSFSKQCLLAQFEQGGITEDVYNTLLEELEENL